MANRFPLQDGDQAPDFSRTDSSTAADRRGRGTQDALTPHGNLYDPNPAFNPVRPAEGSNRAGQPDLEPGDLYRPGSPTPNSFLRAPFNVTASEEGSTTEIREIDICQYGDGYDPKSPMRVRVVDWNMDTDHDGEAN